MVVEREQRRNMGLHAGRRNSNRGDTGGRQGHHSDNMVERAGLVELVTSVILGTKGSRYECQSDEACVHATRGVGHAMVVAGILARQYGDTVLLTVLDASWSGYAILAYPVGRTVGYTICRVEVGMAVECGIRPSSIKRWVDTSTARAVAYIV